MHPIFFFALIVLLSSPPCFAAAQGDLADESSRMSYSIGYQVGGDFQRQGIDIEPEIVLKGVQDALAGREPGMNPEEMHATLIALQKSVQEAQKKKNEKAAEENLAAGRAFLAANGKKAGVVTRPSGLQYIVLAAGKGESPAAADTVEVNYRGTLLDGTEFDSTYTKGKPVQIRAEQVIKGWQEALSLMKPGGKWRLFVPPELAYGNKRTGPIGPNSTLIFDVELLSVSKKAKPGQGQ